MVGHGTHVAGIVKLVAPQASIMPLRVLDREGYGTTFHVAEAIAYADANGADVINLSLGTPSWSMLLREKVDEAISHGVVVVAAAGNYNSLQPQYPASNVLPAALDKDGLLAVTSVSAAQKKSDFANYGTWVDIVAPGEEILSTYPVSKYAYWSGTSMATPFVSGEAALIHSVANSLDPGGVEEQDTPRRQLRGSEKQICLLGYVGRRRTRRRRQPQAGRGQALCPSDEPVTGGDPGGFD